MGNTESKNSLSDAVQFGPCGTDPYHYLSFDESELPRGLKFSMKFLTREQFEFCQHLSRLGQEHLFDGWEEMDPSDRVALVEQLMRVDVELTESGGIEKYIVTAHKMLDLSNCNPERTGMQVMNPMLKGFKPSVPAQNDVFTVGSEEHVRMEELGLQEIGSVGFCVAALRLSDTLVPRSRFKIPRILLPTEIVTETTFLQNCIEHILAISRKYGSHDSQEKYNASLPLCIMTSPETDGPIREYLQKNKCFGMPESSITIVTRKEGVPALFDTEARIALDPDDAKLVLLDSRGHGDFHTLLYENGIAESWLNRRGLKWLYMMEHETNGLAFHPLPLMLGVSKSRDLIMNSLTVPRKAQDNVLGAVCALKNKKTALYKMASVQSHELDALLRASNYENGETNATSDGWSPFRGSTNQLLFDLQEYVSIMNARHGQIPKVICPVFEENEQEDEDEVVDLHEKNAYGKNNTLDSKKPSDNNIHRTHSSSESKKSSKNHHSSRRRDLHSVQSSDTEDPVYVFLQAVSMQSRMQDFAHLLSSSSSEQERLGFTNLDSAELAFSPICNPFVEVVDPILIRKREQLQLPPYTASSAEADQYGAARKLLRALGCSIKEAGPTTYAGDIQVIPGPAIVLKPNFGFCLAQLESKFSVPSHITISARSTLVLRGAGIVVDDLDLDGCLLVDCEDGGELHVDHQICNKGWSIVKDPSAPEEIYRMRGYTIKREEERVIEKTKPEKSSCVLM